MKKLLVVFYLFCVAGLLCHTSVKVQILGKYSVKYFLVLFGVSTLFFPFVWGVGWMSRDSTFHRRDGKIVRMTPARKALFYGMLLLVCMTPFEMFLRARDGKFFSQTGIHYFHPFLQSQPLKNNPKLHINSNGFRGDEIALKKPEGVFRIFLLGGSTVFAADVPFEKSHGYLLEKLLQARYPEKKIEVQNGGYDWYTSEHSLIQYLFKIKEYRPDLIVMWHGVNDLCRSFPGEASYGEFQSDYSHYYGPIARMVFRHFQVDPVVAVHSLLWHDGVIVFSQGQKALFSDIRSRFQKEEPMPPWAGMRDFPSLAPYRRNLISSIQIMQMDGVVLVLGTQPYCYRAKTAYTETMTRGLTLFNEETKSIAEEHHVPRIDLEAKLPKRDEFFLDSVHYSEKGNALIAQELTSFIIQNGYIQ